MTQYKFSENKIGDLPIHIGDGNYSSKYPKASEFVSVGVPFISASDFSNGRISAKEFRFISPEQHATLLKGHIKAGDVLLVTRGNGIGKVAWVDKEFGGCNINAQLALLRADENKVHSRYLYFLLSSKEYFDLLVQYGSGSAQPQLTIGSLTKVPLRLPPYNFQVKIADTMSRFEDKIELNRKMNETLEQIARAIFKSWFIDFDPVHAKKEGRKPFGMSDEVAALFPDSFEKSELGEIPKGWKTRGLLDCVNLIGGGTPKTSNPEFWGGNIPWFSVVDSPSPSDVWVIDTEKKITKAGLEGSSTKLLRPGTTIISARGTVGNLALVGKEMTMNQSCYGVQGKDGYSDFFVFFTIKNLVNILKQNAHGSVFDTITTDTFKNSSIVVPDISSKLISCFEEIASKFMTLVKSNVFESFYLSECRDLILPRLLNGEIEIKGPNG